MDFGKKIQYGITPICVGDSFTAGNNASSNATSYVGLLGSYLGATATNLALSGSESSYATQQILNLPDIRKWPVTYLSGLNDARRYLGNSYRQISGNIRAAIAASFLSESVPASSLIKSGTWTALSSGAGGRSVSLGGTGLYTTDINAYLAYQFTGETLVVGGVSSVYDSGPGGGECQDIDVIVDNGAATRLILQGLSCDGFSYNALVLKNLGPGKHTAIIKPRNGLSWSAVDYVGTLSEPDAKGSMFVGEMPYMINYAYNNSLITKAIVDGANTQIASVVAEFSEWPVVYVPLNSFYDLPTGCSSDGLHPNDVGHKQIFESFKSCMSRYS